MNSLLYLIVVIASNFVNGQANNTTVFSTSTSAPYITTGVYGTPSMTMRSSPIKSSSEGVTTGISPVATGNPRESSAFQASSMTSKVSLSIEKAPATPSMTPSTTVPASITNTVVTSNVSATTYVSSIRPNTTQITNATTYIIANSTSSSGIQFPNTPTSDTTTTLVNSTNSAAGHRATSNVPATTHVTTIRPTFINLTPSVTANSTSFPGSQYVVPSTAMLETPGTTMKLVNSTTAQMFNATTVSTVITNATQSVVQSMTTPPGTVNGSISQMIVSSSSSTNASTTTITMPNNVTMLMSTVQSPTTGTNPSVFSSARIPTKSLAKNLTAYVRTTPVINNMTSSIKGISSSPAISSTAHPSSSHVIPPVPEIVLVRITVDANCNQVLTNQSTFKVAVQSSISNFLNISSSKINISAVTCGSVIVDMAIENVNNENITKKIMNAVNNKQLNISYNEKQLPVTSVDKLITNPITPTATILSVSSDSSTSNSMSSSTVVTEKLSSSPQSVTASQVLAKSSTLPVQSANNTASVVSTHSTNASIFLSATTSSSVAMPPIGQMTTIFVTHITTSAVKNMTTRATNSSIFTNATVLPSHSTGLVQTMTAIRNMNTSFVTRVTTSAVKNMTTRATNSSIFTKATVLPSHSTGLVQTMTAIRNMNTSFVTRVTTSPVANLTTSMKTILLTETLSTSPQSISQVLTNSSTLHFTSVSITTSAHATNSTFAEATMLPSFSSMQTISSTRKTSTRKMTPTINITSLAITTSATEILSRSSQSESISQMLANSSSLSVTAVNATSSRAAMSKHATNSSTFEQATVLSSYTFVVTQTMSPTEKTNTSFVTHVRTSPVANMTASTGGLSSSAISSTTYPSSSHISTPVPPEIVLVRITIDANCNRVELQSADFKNAVLLSCSNVLNIPLSKIKITAVKCGSILVDMEIQNVNNENITKKLEDAVSNNQLNISYNGTQLAVTSVKELTTKPTNDDDDDDNTALIIYIVLGSAIGLAFLITLVVLIVRCRRERSSGTFRLPSEENLELSGFSAQNKAYQRGNFYGDSQPGGNEYRLGGIADESDPMSNGNTEDGNFGSGYLPAWKNLPTMDMSEVHRDDDNNDNLLLMYGKAGEEGNNSDKTGAVTSYQNIGAV